MTIQLDLLDAIDEKKKAGYVCQCCGQFVKMYSRPFLSSMALVLIAIYKSGKTDFFHVERFLKNLNRGDLRGDFHKARFWGLLEKKIELRADNSPRNGFYKITDRKSTRLNSSHPSISYAVFCLKKKTTTQLARASMSHA